MLPNASLPSPAPPERRRFDLKEALVRRRKAAVTLLLCLSMGTAALTLVAFARLMPMRADASHSVRTLERTRDLDTALTKAREAVNNKERTPRESHFLWAAVERPARSVGDLIGEDEAEVAVLSRFNEAMASSLLELTEAVALIERGDPTTAVLARQRAHHAVEQLTSASSAVSREAAAQLDTQMKNAVVWLAVCVGMMLLSGLMMAVTVFIWAYASHLDRKAARRLAALDPSSEEAVESAKRLSQAIDNGPLAVVEWDANFVYTRWSGKAEEMFGRTASQVLGLAWDQMSSHVHPDDADRVQQEIKPLIEGRVDCVVIRHRNIRADGRTIHCVWYNSVLRDRAGHPRTFLSLANDVTALVEAEAAYHQEADMVRRIAESAPVGIAVYAADGSLRFANDCLLRMYGATREDLHQGRGHLQEAVLEELDGTPISVDDRPSMVALRRGESVQGRELRVKVTGSDRSVEVSCTAVPLRDASGKVDGALIFHDDISHRLVSESEREALASELSQSRRLEAVGNLAGGIAHDFGNALLAINYAADGLTAAAGSGHPVQEHAVQLRQAVGLAREMTASLVQYAAGRDATRKPMDLAAFVSQSGKFLARLLPTSFKVEAPMPACPPVMVNASAAQLMQVLLNLVVNARDAMPDGGTLTLTVAEQGGEAVLEATDTGHGLSADVARRLQDRPYSTKDSGRGLGLSIVRQIVHEHGGRLEVMSSPGDGARFVIHLPLLKGSPALRTGSTPAQAVVPAVAAESVPRKALVVEGDDRIRPLIIQTLRNSGYQVESFTNAEAGLAAFNETPLWWGVVLLELDADGLDGATCLRRMRTRNTGLQAVLLASDPSDADGTFVDDKTRVLLKPFTVGSLRTALSDLHGQAISR